MTSMAQRRSIIESCRMSYSSRKLNCIIYRIDDLFCSFHRNPQFSGHYKSVPGFGKKFITFADFSTCVKFLQLLEGERANQFFEIGLNYMHEAHKRQNGDSQKSCAKKSQTVNCLVKGKQRPPVEIKTDR